ncbi:biotin-dependent carboxyltransferase family protein [Chloroflexota bacterium]
MEIMETFEVIQPGPMTTVQDLGRDGYQQYGVSPSGAIDNYSFRVGNILAGNEETAASLEITLFGCQLRVLRDTVVAITGADLATNINGNPAPMFATISISSGDIISFTRPGSGCRAYLAVAGGIDVPIVMGSASTNIKSSMGGLGGRALRRGDLIRTKERSPTKIKARVSPEYIPVYDNAVELRVIPGPQDDCFTEEGIHTFFHADYTVSTQADRMGYRLVGPRIQHRAKADIISDGIPSGAVQVPGNGLPIILLADRQTTGGYTKIAIVISADITKLAQAKPGDSIKFRRVSEEEAIKALSEYEEKIKAVKAELIKPGN